MNSSEAECKESKIIVVRQEYPSVVEVTPLSDHLEIDMQSIKRFGAKGRFNPEQVRKMLLDLEKRLDELQEIPSEYPPQTNPRAYAQLNSKFLARISARRYPEGNQLKTYAVDIGIMEGKIYLFLVAERIDLKEKRRVIKIAPLSSVINAPREWLEGINPDLIRSLSTEG